MKKNTLFLILFYIILLNIFTIENSSGSPPSHTNQSTESLRIQRLETLADLWGKVYLFHPNIVRSDMNIDWNKVLLETIPKVEKAGTTEEFIAVLNNSLFKPLNDPLTFAQRTIKEKKKVKLNIPKELTTKTLTPTIGYINARNPQIYKNPDFIKNFDITFKKLNGIKTLILDLRWPDTIEILPYFNSFLRFFIDSSLITISKISRIHQGWNELGNGRVYYQYWKIKNGYSVEPIQKASSYLKKMYPSADFDSLSTITLPTIILINNTSCLYFIEILNALQSKSNIAIVWEKTGRFNLSNIGSQKYTENIEVHLQTTQPLLPSQKIGFRPDVISEQPIKHEKLLELAENVINKKNLIIPEVTLSFQMRFQSPDPITLNPITKEECLLGLFKIWNVIKYFYPHMEYANIHWPSMLKEWIPEVENTQSIEEYFSILSKLTSKLNDSHIRILHKAIDYGNYTIPVKFARINEKVIVVATKSDPNNLELLPDIGDELIKIDGRSVQEIEADWKNKKSVSTEQSFYRFLYNLNYISRGKKNSEVKLTIRKNDINKIISLKRTTYRRIWNEPTDTTQSKFLENNIGYINLMRIHNLESMDSTLVNLINTDGLVFDMRGYPRFSAQYLIKRISDKPVKSGIFNIPVLTVPDTLKRTWATVQYNFEPHADIYYEKPIVVLIDENAQSKAEDFCIYLKNADRVTFVGSATTGTNGNTTYIHLPAGGKLRFTGSRVKYADGSRFQNIGIVPDVEVKPTIKGIIEGRDEVLEKGIEVLRELIKEDQSH